MYARFGKACLTMAVTGGCCSVVLAASTEESKESVQWAYPSPYDDEDEEDVKRTSCFTFFTSYIYLFLLYTFQIHRTIRRRGKIQTQSTDVGSGWIVEEVANGRG